nr:nicotinamide riboside transporter PnuC [Jiangella anatolica]
MIDWLQSPAWTAFGAPTSRAELLGFLTGAACVWLVGRQSLWNWPVGIANNLLWIALFASAGLYADSGLQVVYIGLAVWGWWNWLNGGGAAALPVTGVTGREWAGLAVAGVAGTATLTVALAAWTPSTVPFWDAVTTVLSLLATWGQARKRWQSWLLWIAADLVYVPLYLHKGLTLTALLYAGFLGLCVAGLVRWRTSMAGTSATVPVPAG